MARTVGVIFNGRHRPDDAILAPLKIDQAIHPPRAATAMSRRDPPVMIPPAVLGQTLKQRLLGPLTLVGQLREIIHRGRSPAGRSRFVVLYTHRVTDCESKIENENPESKIENQKSKIQQREATNSI
jgi:hypothetical protein